MKKTILTIILCGVMVLGLTGCGNSSKENVNSSDNNTTNNEEKSAKTSNVKLNAGYRYTDEDEFAYEQIDLYDDGSVVYSLVNSEKGIVTQCYGQYTIEGKDLTIKLSEQYSFRNNERINYPDGDWYWTIQSDTEIRSERTYSGVKGRNYIYVETLEKKLS